MSKFCENCGAELKDTDKACPNCGAPVEEKTKKDDKVENTDTTTSNTTTNEVKEKKKNHIRKEHLKGFAFE